MPTPRSGRDDVPTEDGLPRSVVLEVGADAAIDGVVLAVRRDGELLELAERSPPVTAELRGDVG